MKEREVGKLEGEFIDNNRSIDMENEKKSVSSH